jgi:hypothetical protein
MIFFLLRDTLPIFGGKASREFVFGGKFCGNRNLDCRHYIRYLKSV